MREKCGLLLVNLGSPDAPTASAVRTYLAEFLHDKRVIDTSRWIWCPILHGIILPLRPARSAKLYKKVWGEPGTEAPLIQTSRLISQGVSKVLGEGVIVETAMRYGQPSIGSALERLEEQGCRKIAVLPLYPQFAGATTASVYDGVAKALKSKMDVPELRFLRDYHQEAEYIEALARSVNEHLGALDFEPDVILASYHGLPQSYVDKGDPYQDECLRTTDLLREALSLTESQMRTSFQSRFGPKQWLTPYTNETLENLAEEGLRKVAIITPGFAADCLETLEEIAIEAKDEFLAAGGTHFSYVPCLNDRKDHVKMLANVARARLLSAWF